MKRLYRVLLAENDEISAKLVMHTLEKYNFSITHVLDGMAALSKVRIEEFDLIISDIMMPYLDGLSFLEKGQEFIRDTPVIVLTAVGDRKNVLRAAQSQVSHYILKPIEMYSFIEKVVNCLNLAPDSLIEKRNHPLKKLIQYLNNDTILLELDGCPKKNSSDEIYYDLFNSIENHSGAMQMKIIIQPFFFLEAGSFRILDDLILKLIKNTPLRSAHILIHAQEIKEARLDPDKFPNLLGCKIEIRS